MESLEQLFAFQLIDTYFLGSVLQIQKWSYSMLVELFDHFWIFAYDYFDSQILVGVIILFAWNSNNVRLS